MTKVLPFPNPNDLAAACNFVQARAKVTTYSRTATVATGVVRAIMDKYGLRRLPCGDIVAVTSDIPGWVELRPRARIPRWARRGGRVD